MTHVKGDQRKKPHWRQIKKSLFLGAKKMVAWVNVSIVGENLLRRCSILGSWDFF